MSTLIPQLHSMPSRRHARRWVRSVVKTIGPGFHCDTPPGDYRGPDGLPYLSDGECESLSSGLDRAEQKLGQTAFEKTCLDAVHHSLGWRYDRSEDRLVHID